MKTSNLERISLSTLFIMAIFIGFLDTFGFLDNSVWVQKEIPSITLILLGVFMLYFVNTSFSVLKDLSGFEEKLAENKKELLEALNGIESQLYTNAEDAFRHLTRVLRDANHSVDQVAIAPTPRLRDEVIHDYVASLEEVLTANKVNYRYITTDSYTPRWHRLTQFSENSLMNKFYLRYFRGDSNIKIIPILNFFIIDHNEIFMRYPHEPGQPEIYLLIKQRHITKLFEAYYERIWESASPYNNQH